MSLAMANSISNSVVFDYLSNTLAELLLTYPQLCWYPCELFTPLSLHQTQLSWFFFQHFVTHSYHLWYYPFSTLIFNLSVPSYNLPAPYTVPSLPVLFFLGGGMGGFFSVISARLFCTLCFSSFCKSVPSLPFAVSTF